MQQVKVANSDAQIPIVGLGTWKSKEGEVGEAVKAAVRNGYRHIDCAHIYGNEGEIGQALAELFSEGYKREDLWITSKLWNNSHHPEAVKPAIELTLKNLGLEYLDLYLIHWPIPVPYIDGQAAPTDEYGSPMVTYVSNVDTWKAMEDVVDQGLTKFIGLSNFNPTQIKEIKDVSRIPISFLQCENHPYLPQDELVQFCKENDIVFESYSPLGSPDRPWSMENDPTPLLEHEVVLALAEKYGKNAGQILIKFQVQRGNVVLAKSVTESRIIGNLDVFDFELSQEDLNSLLELSNGWRACTMYSNRLHPYFPFDLKF